MSSPPRVLVVDDNLDLADGLTWVFEAEGLEVETAYTAEQALARMEASRFDVVVLDFKLPGLSGFAARRAIATRQPTARCVTMTGWSIDQLLSQTLGRNAVRVLRHPFSTPSLASALAALEGGGLLLIAGTGADSTAALAASLGELGVRFVIAGDSAGAAAALDSPSGCLVLEFERPIVEVLDVYFALLESRDDEIRSRRVVLHARPIAPDASDDDVLTSHASSGLFVKPMFDFEDVLRVVVGSG